MNAFVVTASEYCDHNYDILGVFSTIEKAENFKKRFLAYEFIGIKESNIGYWNRLFQPSGSYYDNTCRIEIWSHEVDDLEKFIKDEGLDESQVQFGSFPA